MVALLGFPKRGNIICALIVCMKGSRKPAGKTEYPLNIILTRTSIVLLLYIMRRGTMRVDSIATRRASGKIPKAPNPDYRGEPISQYICLLSPMPGFVERHASPPGRFILRRSECAERVKQRGKKSFNEGVAMRKSYRLIVVLFCFFAGCSSMGMNSVTKLNQLSPGMTQEEVIKVLGQQPKSTQLKGEAWILKFSLHENWKGFVPYYMVFDAETKKLVSWYADETEYEKNQARLAETFKPLLESGGGAGGAGGPDDTNLKQWIAGEYYSYVGSTERTLILCENGKFSYASEASYSGTRNSDGTTDWGAASRSGNAGSWTINGSKEEGTVTLKYSSGKTGSMKYRPSGETNVMLFDGIKFAFVKKAICQ